LEEEAEEIRHELREAISSHRDQKTNELRGELLNFLEDLKRKDGFIYALEQSSEELARAWDSKIRNEIEVIRSMSLENQKSLAKLQEKYKAEVSYGEKKNSAQRSTLEREIMALQSQTVAISKARDTHIAMASMAFRGIGAATGAISAVSPYLALLGCIVM